MNDESVALENVLNCPLCGCARQRVLCEPDIVRCDDCRVVYRSPRPTQQEIKKHYDRGVTFDQWLLHEGDREKEWRRRLRTILPYISTGLLLDVGAGDGHFLGIARDAGFDVEGVELSGNGVARCRSRGLKVHQGQLSEVDFGVKQFDVVTIWHVLEHVPNPGEVLLRIFQLLKPGGILVVAVPNEEKRIIRHRLHRGRSDNPFALPVQWVEVHLTHFQPHTLCHALRRSGFSLNEFGVDDIYFKRSVRNLAVLALQRSLARIFHWHFSMAMYAICCRPRIRSQN